jgi:hypothetical protein
MNVINATVSMPPPLPWWVLPPNFVPAELFHPKLSIVTEGRVLKRAGEKFLAWDKVGATDLMHALLRATHYPVPVARESVRIEAVPVGNEGKEEA